MRYNKVIQLISTEIPLDEYGNPATDEFGNPIKNKTEKKVFANENSIGSSEYYNAASEGLRPEVKFEIRTVEYDSEKEIKYNGDIYNIIQSQSMGEKTILTCEKVNADV